MLNENLRALRKSKGLSQEELAAKLYVVRQTVSKWEKGLSVPDSDMLISISEALDTPVSVLLGETVEEKKPDELKVISEKLEVINLQLAQNRESRRKAVHFLFIALCAAIVVIFALLAITDNSFTKWNYSDTGTAVLGTFVHAFAWVFMRAAPFALAGAVVGAVLTRKKR